MPSTCDSAYEVTACTSVAAPVTSAIGISSSVRALGEDVVDQELRRRRQHEAAQPVDEHQRPGRARGGRGAPTPGRSLPATLRTSGSSSWRPWRPSRRSRRLAAGVADDRSPASFPGIAVLFRSCLATIRSMALFSRVIRRGRLRFMHFALPAILAVTLLAPTAAVAQPTRQVPVDSLIYDLRNPDPVRRREAVVLIGQNKVQRAVPDVVADRRRSGCRGPPRHRRDAAGARRHRRAAWPGRADQRPRARHPRLGGHGRHAALPAARERHRTVADAGRQLPQPLLGRVGRRRRRARSRRRSDGGARARGPAPGSERRDPAQGGALHRHPPRPSRGAGARPRDEGGPQPEPSASRRSAPSARSATAAPPRTCCRSRCRPTPSCGQRPRWRSVACTTRPRCRS